MLALFLAALDQNIVATAGPEIQRALAIEPSLYVWITTAYMVASTVFVPIYGKLSDLYGRKRILLFGICVFLLASVLCGLSQTAGQLIVCRALQGMGSASLFTSAFAVVADIFPPAERGKYTGLFGSVFALASIVGPLAGGFITDHWGWHWVFLINLPLGLLAVAFIASRMPALRRYSDKPPRVDVLGALSLALTVVPLLFALSFGRTVLRPHDNGFLWSSWPIAVLFIVAAVGLVAFLFVERRAPEPLLDLKLFQNRVFAVGNLTIFTMGAAFMSPMVFLPLYMVNVVGTSATGSGLTTMPLVFGIVAGNIISGQLVSRLGKYKLLMIIGLVILLFAFAVMGFTLHADSTQHEVTLKMILVGLGLGPSIPLYTIAIQNAVSPSQIGVATSSATFFRQMGATVGIAIAGSIFANALAQGMTERVAAATKGLPPPLAEQFQKRAQGSPSAPSSEGEGAHDLRFDTTAAKDKVRAQLEVAQQATHQALLGDPSAIALVKQSPLADARLKTMLEVGGPRAMVKRSYEAMWQRVLVASHQADVSAWQALKSAGDWPREVRQRLNVIPPEALKQPAQREEVLRGVKQALDEAQATAEEKAEVQALESVDRAITEAKSKVETAIDAVGFGMKQAFTDAISLVYRVAWVVAFLGLLLTLALPQLPLRKSNAMPTPSE
ncbi:MAG: MFS transporter [Myxococcaceae bacterium]|nr:MFS transporter [Myxococcaceae bacterium]